MTWLHALLVNESIARTILLLGIAVAAGMALGKIKIAGVGLGVAGVLFSGLLLGHFGLTIDHHVLEFVREFGLILFVYTLGLQIGPGFFGLIKSRGLGLNAYAAGVIGLGALITAGWILLDQMSPVAGVGVLTGATTNTPSLAAAQQAVDQVGASAEIGSLLGLGYAVAYPFGILGIILTILLIRKMFRIDVAAEVRAAEDAQASSTPVPATRCLIVRNPNLVGQRIRTVPGLNAPNVVVSRYSRDGVVRVARRDTELQPEDILLVVGPAAQLSQLHLVVGPESEVDLKHVEGPVVNRRLLVTHREVFGRTVDQVTAFADRGVVVTRVTRGGLQFTPSPQVKLQFGDILMVVGEPGQIDAVAPVVGNAPKALDEPQPITFFIGIALGVLLGSIPVVLPGVPAPVKLGLAGGPLIVAILLSRATNTGPLVWHLPHTANLMLREIGIALFLAAVGLKSGERFAEVLGGPQGVWWLALGATITFIPIFVIGVLARWWGKLNYVEICGLLAGSMTDPPALAFAQAHTNSTAPAVTYATVYPLTMLMRVFAAQLLIFWLYTS